MLGRVLLYGTPKRGIQPGLGHPEREQAREQETEDDGIDRGHDQARHFQTTNPDQDSEPSKSVQEHTRLRTTICEFAYTARIGIGQSFT